MIKIILGVVLVTIAVITTFLVLDPSVGVQTVAPMAEVAPTFIAYIDGEVVKADKYTMAEGSLLKDLIAAAGGLSNNADERAFYENAVITAGQTYYIASKYDLNDLCSMSEIEKVNVNVDDAETLATVNGISTTIANSIITYRDENGLFSTLEQLLEVHGIGNATYRKIRNYVILHA